MDYKKIYNEDYFSGKNSFFYKFGYQDFDFYFSSLFKHIYKYTKNLKKARVIDIGCAYGFILKRFPKSFELFGVDVSEYAISKAKANLPRAKLKVCNIEREVPFSKIHFDLVLMNDVIEHIKNPEKAIKNIKKIMKKGALLYITTPNLNLIRKIIFKYPDKLEHHISLFEHKEIIALLEKSGFEILEHWTFIDLLSFMKLKSNIGPETAIICKQIDSFIK